jgi:hypothetical protein
LRLNRVLSESSRFVDPPIVKYCLKPDSSIPEPSSLAVAVSDVISISTRVASLPAERACDPSDRETHTSPPSSVARRHDSPSTTLIRGSLRGKVLDRPSDQALCRVDTRIRRVEDGWLHRRYFLTISA